MLFRSNRELVSKVLRDASCPVVLDADGLNSVAGTEFQGKGVATILTPHPGEMARLLGRKVQHRVADARALAQQRNVCLVLKGHRTLIALPDGRVYVLEANANPNLAYGEDFAESAEVAGISYEELLNKIMNLGINYPAPWKQFHQP